MTVKRQWTKPQITPVQLTDDQTQSILNQALSDALRLEQRLLEFSRGRENSGSSERRDKCA